jgi:hypothetical protein
MEYIDIRTPQEKKMTVHNDIYLSAGTSTSAGRKTFSVESNDRV